jgi:hypothetical protein
MEERRKRLGRDEREIGRREAGDEGERRKKRKRREVSEKEKRRRRE